MTDDLVLPSIVESWYYVCRSRDLPRGRTLAWSLPDLPLVVYRGASGQPYAIPAHCAHMGTHLVHGDVIDERLRCPLHHWMYDGDGRCTPSDACRTASSRASSSRNRGSAFPVIERDGALYVYAGRTPRFALPSWIDSDDTDPDAWCVSIGRPVHVDTSWQACALNGFDVLHFETVHKRAMREPPIVRTIGDHAIELRYVSRVVGDAPADRLMRRLAKDCVRVAIACWGGNLFVVRSEAGSFVNHLMLCLMPNDGKLIVTPLVAVPRSRVPGLDRLRTAMTRWLFLSFLGRDLAPLSGIRLRAEAALDTDGPLATFTRWLAARPSIGSPRAQPSEYAAPAMRIALQARRRVDR
jgi:aminopyrrolnitrin oxygenase